MDRKGSLIFLIPVVGFLYLTFLAITKPDVRFWNDRYSKTIIAGIVIQLISVSFVSLLIQIYT